MKLVFGLRGVSSRILRKVEDGRPSFVCLRQVMMPGLGTHRNIHCAVGARVPWDCDGIRSKAYARAWRTRFKRGGSVALQGQNAPRMMGNFCRAVHGMKTSAFQNAYTQGATEWLELKRS